MKGNVIRAFIDKHNGSGYHVGDVYVAEEQRLLELQSLGYVEITELIEQRLLELQSIGYVKITEPTKPPDKQSVSDSDTQTAEEVENVSDCDTPVKKKTSSRKTAK